MSSHGRRVVSSYTLFTVVLMFPLVINVLYRIIILYNLLVGGAGMGCRYEPCNGSLCHLL